MSEELIIQQCSPTLAGLKTGSMFNCTYSSRSGLCREIRHMNSRIKSKGLRIIPLRITARDAMIYIYRPAKLEKDLTHPVAMSILAERGYTMCSTAQCIAQLMRRLCDDSRFPHEIGLFLGYPPEDVSGFIKNGAAGHKTCGHWKVYGNEKAAVKTFTQFKKCTRVYIDRCACGCPIERLAVSE